MSRLRTVLVVGMLVLAGAAGPAAATATTGTGAQDATTTQDGVQDATTAQGGVAAVAQQTANNTSDAETLTLFAYNDIQTAAAEDTTLPRLVTLVNERRAAHDNPTVTVGGGDQVSPHALSPLSQWTVPVDVLNVLDPDAEVIGNHDLDYGFDAVANFSAASEFPWLMANIVDSETGEPIPGTEPYTVVERQGVKVGVIGLADAAIKSKTAVDFAEQGYELQNYSTVASEYATQLKNEQGVDVVVAAAHVGIPESKTLANTTEHVDVVVAGDDEVEYPPQETSGTVIVEAQARAEHLGELNLTVEDGDVTAWNGRLLDVTDDIPKNDTASTIITDAREDELNAVAGETTVALDARFSSNYHDETALGNMITDAFRAQTGAEVAITNAGGIRSNGIYGPGNVTVGDVYSILPFRNTLVTVELNGSELKQLLASQVVTLESYTGQQYGVEAQLQVSGVTYEFASHKWQEPYVREAWVNGEEVTANETYNVTVNSYMAGWEGLLADEPRVSTTNMLYGTALLEYVQENSPVSPEDTNRIRRVDDFAEVESVSVRKGDATLALDAPENLTDVVADSFYVTHADTTDRLPAESVSVDGDTVEVEFAMSDLAPYLGQNGDAELYGEYDAAEYNRSYFEHSILNADFERGVFGEGDEGDEGPGDNPGNGPGNSPGNGPDNGNGPGNGNGPPLVGAVTSSVASLPA